MRNPVRRSGPRPHHRSVRQHRHRHACSPCPADHVGARFALALRSTTEAMATADIVDTAVAAGDFTTLAAALTAAGLVETLKGPGPFTVFAPTDAAFESFPAGTVDTLLKDPKGDLTQILTYHVVPGKVMAADVLTMDGQKVKTVQGGELHDQRRGRQGLAHRRRGRHVERDGHRCRGEQRCHSRHRHRAHAQVTTSADA